MRDFGDSSFLLLPLTPEPLSNVHRVTPGIRPPRVRGDHTRKFQWGVHVDADIYWSESDMAECFFLRRLQANKPYVS